MIITKDNKGGFIIILGSDDYNSKMIKHLTTSGIYRKLSHNPISNLIKEVNKANSNSNFDERLKNKLNPNCEIP